MCHAISDSQRRQCCRNWPIYLYLYTLKSLERLDDFHIVLVVVLVLYNLNYFLKIWFKSCLFANSISSCIKRSHDIVNLSCFLSTILVQNQFTTSWFLQNSKHKYPVSWTVRKIWTHSRVSVSRLTQFLKNWFCSLQKRFKNQSRYLQDCSYTATVGDCKSHGSGTKVSW